MNGPTAQADILVSGPAAHGRGLVFSAPISFWGGIDAKTSSVIDVRHPNHGTETAGRVLFLPGTIGSSSASAILLELVRAGLAPAAIVLHEPDAILLLGLIVAREMTWAAPIALRLDRDQHRLFHERQVSVTADGRIAAA